MIELEVSINEDQNYTLWLHGREVGGLQLFDHDLSDQVFSNSCVIIRRGHMDSDLADKHSAFKKRNENKCRTTKSS